MLDGLSLQDNGIPLHVQLREQILLAVRRGALPPGARLPTMREVAVALGINLHAVQRAYGELEREGVLTMVSGQGSYVAEVPPPPRDRRAEAQEFALKVWAEARTLGISHDDLFEALNRLRSAP